MVSNYSPSDIDKRLREFIKDYSVPQLSGVDSLSSILIYIPQMLDEREAKIRAQDSRIRERDNQIREKDGEVQRLTERKEKYKRESQDIQRQLDLAVQDRNRIGEDLRLSQETMTLMKEGHGRKVAEMERQMALMEEAHRHELETQRTILQDEINRFKNRIASYDTGNFRLITDENFQATLESLAQKISNLISYVPRPEPHSFDSSLDPTGYLVRNAQQGTRVWPKFIRSICWGIAVRGFFQYPLGFGVFGTQGEGFSILSHLYETIAIPSPSDPNIRVLPNDKKNNEGRGFFFERMLGGILNPVDPNKVEGFTSYFLANIDAVAEEMVQTLQKCSGYRLDERAPAQIASVARGLGILSLEMGSQPAHIILEGCSHGDWIRPGDMFKDEYETEGGSPVQVDLMTEPCMVRIGNGREDLTTRKVVSKGNIITLKTAY
ncbi:hypothetical protein B0H66DRAFT_475876 [Apodospora peruviana]|uniref:Uncharacterized protein n=1 Tax=Apodospora peruviana TaxID=516989 RepID=A0AAE0I6R6_9PEZI|nr:hypothetical protein B0H66DRAFT_475876 [Apodospora peruviana]